MTIEIPKNVEAIEVVGLKEWLNEHDKKIRADVIDKCVFRLETHCAANNFKGIPVEDIKGILEELKEKKDD